MSRMRYLILIIMLSLSSCNNGVEVDCEVNWGGITYLAIADTVPINEEIDIKVIYQLPDPCHYIEKINSLHTDTSLSLYAKVCYEINEDIACPSVLVEDSTTVGVIFQNPGIKSIYIRDTLFVKNVVVI